MERPFQDFWPHFGCWGCGTDNRKGLQIKSFWDGDDGVCTWQPGPEHIAGEGYLNGGIMATLLDCHMACTAVAAIYRAENRALDSDPTVWALTATMTVDYLAPTPIAGPILLRARVVELAEKKVLMAATARVGQVETARGEGVFVRVRQPLAD